MTDFNEIGKTMLRNRLLAAWAAGKLGKDGEDARAYGAELAACAVGDGDVFGRIKADFQAAGLAPTDQEIGDAITRFTIQAGETFSTGGGGFSDAAAVALKRNLTGR
jgi:hypothetical protein